MPLNIEAKKEVVKELNSEANNSVAGAIAEFSGLNVKDLTLLRTRARESDIYLKVVKNSLSRRAFAETNFECLVCLLYTSPSPRDGLLSRMPSSA